MDGYDATTYGERWADVYDEWYDDPELTDAVVGFVSDLAGPPGGGRPIVELGVGTGLLALPLLALGYDVRGIDASPAMVAKLREKPGGDRLPVTIGDMAALEVPSAGSLAGDARAEARTDAVDLEPRCRGVFVAANSFFGLSTEDDQRRCLRRARDVLVPGGWLMISAFVPDEVVRTGDGSNVGVRSMDADRVVLTADRYDADNQTISGQYIDISSAGITLRPFHIRYLMPDQLDALAREVGLRPTERFGGWDRRPFEDDSPMFVSVFRR